MRPPSHAKTEITGMVRLYQYAPKHAPSCYDGSLKEVPYALASNDSHAPENPVYSVTELCAQFGISRKTGYQWIDWYFERARRDLRPQFRRPPSYPAPQRRMW